MVSFKPVIFTALTVLFAVENISSVLTADSASNGSSGTSNTNTGTNQAAGTTSGAQAGQSGQQASSSNTQSQNTGSQATQNAESQDSAQGAAQEAAVTVDDQKKALALDIDLMKETKTICETVKTKLKTKADTKASKITSEDDKTFVDDKKKEVEEKVKTIDENLANVVKTKKVKVNASGITEAADCNEQVDSVDDGVSDALTALSTGISDLKSLADELAQKAADALKDDEATTNERNDVKEKADFLVESCGKIGTILEKLVTYLNTETIQATKKEYEEHKNTLTTLKGKLDSEEEDFNAVFNDMTAEAQHAVDDVKKAIDAVVSHRKDKSIVVDETLLSNLSALVKTIIETSRAFLPGLAFAVSSVAIYLF